MTHEFSELVSLPLLEKNDRTIHSLLTDAANKKDVIYASVVDHRNKVIAFTGTGHLMPDMIDVAHSVEKVSVWEGGFASHAKFLNFASDVTYAAALGLPAILLVIYVALRRAERLGEAH